MKGRIVALLIVAPLMSCPTDAVAESTSPMPERWFDLVTNFFKPTDAPPVEQELMLRVDEEYRDNRITDTEYRAKLGPSNKSSYDTSANQYRRLDADGEFNPSKIKENHLIQTLKGHNTIKSQ